MIDAQPWPCSTDLDFLGFCIFVDDFFVQRVNIPNKDAGWRKGLWIETISKKSNMWVVYGYTGFITWHQPKQCTFQKGNQPQSICICTAWSSHGIFSPLFRCLLPFSSFRCGTSFSSPFSCKVAAPPKVLKKFQFVGEMWLGKGEFSRPNGIIFIKQPIDFPEIRGNFPELNHHVWVEVVFWGRY